MTVERRASDRGGNRGGVLGTPVPVGILTSPFQWVVAVLSAALAVAVTTSRLLGAPGVLPVPLLITWGVMLLIGGAGTAVVMLIPRGPRVLPSETATLVLLATGWLVYSLGYAAQPDSAVGPLLVGPFLASACALRIHAIAVTARVLRRQEALRQELNQAGTT